MQREALISDALVTMLGSDPLPWVLSSDEPFAAWAALTGVLGRAADDPEVIAAHRRTLSDARVQHLISELPPWGEADFPGHHSPLFLPNRLNLLADMGVGPGDSPAVDRMIDQLLSRQDKAGHFQSLGKAPGRPKPEWGSLLCDTHAITDVALRYGRLGDERVGRALDRMRADLAETPQGRAWQCVPEARTLFRGPGRRADVCPQVTLEALRAFSQAPGDRAWLLDVARTPLEIWRRRDRERPYQFGHGYQFKSVKWPNFWYDVLWVLETVGRYPELWKGPRARAEDVASIAEIAACLVAYNVDACGRVVPRRTYKGFERFSFAQKRDPSPFATARVVLSLARVADLAEMVAAVDVEALPGSKGGSGTPVPPPRRLIRVPEPPAACPVPRRIRQYPWDAALPRVLSRHHLQWRWENATPESVVADVMAVHSAHPFAPYASLEARLPGFDPGLLERALFERRTLVTYRGMRGLVFIVRTDLLPSLYAATNEVVVRAARKHARWRGVDADSYATLVPRVLALASEGPVSTDEIRASLAPDLDVAAAVTLMLAEGLLLRDRPVAGWLDRNRRYVATASALPDLRLDSVRLADAQATLVRGYVRAFGPVQVRDIAWWTGIGPKRVAEAIDALGDEIVEVELRGAPSAEPYVMHAADVDELEIGPVEEGAVSLLPAMDTIAMGYANKGRFIDDAHLRFVYDRNGSATSIVLASGRVAGVWDIATSPEPCVLVHLFEAVNDADKAAIESRALDVGRLRFEGAEVPVRWVRSMLPLADRDTGWVVKPLR